ncbi:MAG TPA: hypothetical protein VFQ53_09140 [Kofleriaceae bacterium]|nr:hypothetical protein [Kofleriaceae bacterium]
MRGLLLLVPLAACTDPVDPIPEPPAHVATGALDAWQMQAALPVARANHCATAIGDWVLVIGGNFKQGDTFVKTDQIHAAQLQPDGTLGAWQLAGTTPSPVTECTATSDGTTLYILDGLYDRDADARQIYAAALDDTGHLAPLASIGSLPQIAISSEATVHDAELVLMDSVLPADGDQTVALRRAVDAPAWTTDDWGIGFRAQAEYAFTDGFAYTLGGYKGDEGNPVTDEVFFTTFAADGSLGNTRPTTKLPAPVAFGEAVAVDDYVFVAGGRAQVFGGAATTSVYAAHVEADGSLAPWTTLAPLPMARTNHELVVVGDYLVIAGGAGAAGGDTTVLTARVRFEPPAAD